MKKIQKKNVKKKPNESKLTWQTHNPRYETWITQQKGNNHQDQRPIT